MKKVLLLTDKPFAQVAIDGIQEVVAKAGYELKVWHRYGSRKESGRRCGRFNYP